MGLCNNVYHLYKIIISMLTDMIQQRPITMHKNGLWIVRRYKERNNNLAHLSPSFSITICSLYSLCFSTKPLKTTSNGQLKHKSDWELRFGYWFHNLLGLGIEWGKLLISKLISQADIS